MERRHRIVHLISFVAIIVSLFSPVLSLPVIAEDDVPEPEVTLNQDQAEPDPNTPDPETQGPVDPNTPGNESQKVPSGNGDESEQEVTEPVLTAVAPVFPTLTDATCGDGVVYAQTATAPVTDGVSYEIGSPDAAGAFTVTATLTDPSVYTWSDTGLDGWTVVDNTATASGTLALCPVPEPEDVPDVPDESGEGTDPVDETSQDDGTAVDDNAEIDDKEIDTVEENPSSITTSGVNARSSQMAPTAANITLTYNVTPEGPVEPGTEMAFQTWVSSDQKFNEPITFTLPTGTTYTRWEAHTKTPYGPELEDASSYGSCFSETGSLNCQLYNNYTLRTGHYLIWTVFAIVDTPSEATCQNDGILSSSVTGRWGGGPTLTGSTSVNCPPAPELTLEISREPAAANDNDEIEFTVTVRNQGSANSGNYSFNASFSDQDQFAFKQPALVSGPDGSTCTINEGPGAPTFIHCAQNGGDPIPPESSHVYSVTVVVNTEICIPELRSRVGGAEDEAVWADGYRIGEDVPQIYTSINCHPELSITADTSATNGVIEEITPFNYNVLVENTGNTDSGDFSFTTALPPGFVLSSNDQIVPVGASCDDNTSNGTTTIDCNGPSFAPDDEPYLFIFRVVADSELYTGICDSPTSFTATGVNGEWEDPNSSTTSTFTVNCNAAPLLTVAFNADKTEVEAGDIINYTATITNDGNKTEDRYSFTAYISGDATLLLENPAIVTSGGVTCEPDGDRIDCSAQNMAPEDVHTLTYSVQVTPDDSGTSCGAIGATFGFGSAGMWDDDTEHNVYVDRLCPILSLDLGDGIAEGESVGLKEVFTYTYTLTNTGDSAKGDYAFLASLPEGVVLAPDSVLDSRCEFDSFEGITLLGCAGSDIPIGEENGHTFEVDVVAVGSVDAPACGTVTAVAQLVEGIWVEGVETASVDTNIECNPSVDYSIEPLNSPVVPGETIGFNIRIHNDGDVDITQITSSNTVLPDLPENLSWTTSLTYNDDPSQSIPQWLAPGDVLVFTFESPTIPPDLTLPESEWCKAWTMSSDFTAGFAYGDDQTYSDSGTVQVNCTGLSIVQEVSSGKIAFGGQVEFTITVTNQGNTTVSPMMVFHDSTETGTVFSNWQVTSEDYLDCGLVEDIDPGCTYLALDPGDSIQISVTGDAPESPTLEQCAPVESAAVFVYGEALTPMIAQVDQSPPYTQIFSEPVDVQLDCQSEISVEMEGDIDTGDNDRVDAGDTVTLTINVTNSGNMPLYDIIVQSSMENLEWDKDLTIAEVLPGSSETFTAVYTISQEDIDAGVLESTTWVEAFLEPGDDAAAYVQVLGLARAQVALVIGDPISSTDTLQVELGQEPGIQLEISSDVNEEPALEDIVTYTFTVTNTGNVTLTDIDILPETNGLVFANGTTIASLAPGEQAKLIGTYTITQADVDAGSLVVCADSIGLDPNSEAISDTAECSEIAITQPDTVTPTPEPTSPPATPEPTTPVIPDPATPVPDAPDADETPAPVTSLPETGTGNVVSMASVLWIAATIGILAFGIGAAGVRKGSRH